MKTAQAPTADELAAAYSTPRWGEIGERDALLAQSFGYERLLSTYQNAFPLISTWQGRKAVLFNLLRYARKHSVVVDIARSALNDRSALVREEACGVLAFSLDEASIPHLEALLEHPHAATRGAAVAAIDAIRHKNHNYFLDRGHSGETLWQVRPAT